MAHADQAGARCQGPGGALHHDGGVVIDLHALEDDAVALLQAEDGLVRHRVLLAGDQHLVPRLPREAADDRREAVGRAHGEGDLALRRSEEGGQPRPRRIGRLVRQGIPLDWRHVLLVELVEAGLHGRVHLPRGQPDAAGVELDPPAEAGVVGADLLEVHGSCLLVVSSSTASVIASRTASRQPGARHEGSSW